MKPYPSYKDSGVEWIGEIPSGWDSIRLKYIGFLYGGLSGKSGRDFNQDDNPNNKPFIPFTNISDNTHISNNHLGKVVVLEDEEQNVVKQFDLFFLMSSETQEDVGKSSVLKDDIGEVYLNSFCRGFRITDEKYSPLFINYLLSGHSYRELLSVEGKGFTRINLRTNKVNDLELSSPPLPEQHQIVSYLDHKTQKIDELIEKTEQKIGLLKEKRTSLINHCVTKGLNPNVEMKDSGVEWIGEIPSGWEVVRTKHISDFGNGYSYKSEEWVGEGIPVIRMSNISEDGKLKITDSNTKFISQKSSENTQQFKLDKGDILISMTDMNPKLLLLGKTMIFDLDGDYFLNQRVGRITITSDKCLIKFYHYISNTDCVRNQLKDSVYPNVQSNLSTEYIRNGKIALPPLPEQQQIVSYLDEQTQKINTTIEIETQRIELLKEYRQSLISEVVTGKIDVRDYNG